MRVSSGLAALIGDRRRRQRRELFTQLVVWADGFQSVIFGEASQAEIRT